ncbi:MAG: hypothetical protein M1833_004919 [Piccolia ochrophora]|nr:MAG: hypothetical protein M1833_004919 [Piccolia ochrophora]
MDSSSTPTMDGSEEGSCAKRRKMGQSQSDLEESLFSNFVIVLVGPELTKYNVYKDKICSQSPFFKAACYGQFVEATQGVIKLPEDEPHIFEAFLHWLFFDDPFPKGYSEDSVEDAEKCALLWIMADKFQVPEMKPLLLKLLSRTTQILDAHAISQIYLHTTKGSPLRKLLVADTAILEPHRFAFDADFPSEFLFDTIRAMAELRIWLAEDARAIDWFNRQAEGIREK